LPHVIICGLGRIGWPVLDYLRAADWSIAAIDQEAKADDPRLKNIQLVSGDFRDRSVLQQAGLDRADGVLILANDDLTNLAAGLEVRRLRADVKIIVRLFNENLLNKLGQAISNVIALSSSRLAAPLLASAALTGDLLASFSINQQTWHIITIKVDPASSLVGQTWEQIQQAHSGLHQIFPPLKKGEASERIAPGSQLIIAGTPAALENLRTKAQAEETLALRWASVLQRIARTAWRTFWEIEWPVRYAAICLFTVVMLGSLIFWSTGIRPTWPKSLLHTLNIMVTSADLRTSQDSSTWEEIFISFLKFAGLMLTAAFTALMTNYLVRARLGGALAARRIPEAGHVVLCGLGTVGVRVVEHLRANEAAVVVIEKAESTRFVGAARQKGATVLLGDGTVQATLIRARTASARALIAATSSDLANVEMALLARELNPKLRVVVRLDDGTLAVSLRETANIRYALGLPVLTAPAFVAPLFGDAMLGLFWLDGTLHAILEIKVEGQTQPQLADLKSALQTELGAQVLSPQSVASQASLAVSERMVVIVPIDKVAACLKMSNQSRLGG
jgi:Trk K+ transport system NAD-binding subunit